MRIAPGLSYIHPPFTILVPALRECVIFVFYVCVCVSVLFVTLRFLVLYDLRTDKKSGASSSTDTLDYLL